MKRNAVLRKTGRSMDAEQAVSEDMNPNMDVEHLAVSAPMVRRACAVSVLVVENIPGARDGFHTPPKAEQSPVAALLFDGHLASGFGSSRDRSRLACRMGRPALCMGEGRQGGRAAVTPSQAERGTDGCVRAKNNSFSFTAPWAWARAPFARRCKSD